MGDLRGDLRGDSGAENYERDKGSSENQELVLRRQLESITSLLNSIVSNVSQPLVISPGPHTSVPNGEKPKSTQGDDYRRILLKSGDTGDRKQAGSKRVLSKTSLKLEQIRARSSDGPPVCFRCGDSGHWARDCRNALVCFECGGLGHKSRECRRQVSTTHIKESFPKSTKTESQISPSSTTKTMYHFEDTPTSLELDAAFRRSVVLHDSEGWG